MREMFGRIFYESIVRAQLTDPADTAKLQILLHLPSSGKSGLLERYLRFLDRAAFTNSGLLCSDTFGERRDMTMVNLIRLCVGKSLDRSEKGTHRETVRLDVGHAS